MFLRRLINTTVMLNEHGLRLHSLAENIDTTTPSARLNRVMLHFRWEMALEMCTDQEPGRAWVCASTEARTLKSFCRIMGDKSSQSLKQ